jgi:hypothetical protein
LVATHPRLKDPGKRSTVRDHLPPQAQAYLMNLFSSVDTLETAAN